MIFLSLVLVIVAAVTLVLGVFQDGLELIYVAIATCVASMAVLGAGVLLRRREEATTGPASYGDGGGAREAVAVARTPAAPVVERRAEPEAAFTDTAAAERPTAVVRKVTATPTETVAPSSADEVFRRPAAVDTSASNDDSAWQGEGAVAAPVTAPTGTAAAATGGVSAAAARGDDDAEASPPRPATKRAVVKRTAPAAEPARGPAEAVPAAAASETAATASADDAPAKKAQAKKATAKKATAKKATAKKATAAAPAKKATAKKATAKKATAGAPAKKATAKKATAGAPAKKATAKKATRGSGRSVQDLAKVRGLGATKRDRLVERFGSIDGVAAATVEELSAVPGVGVGTAQAIKEALG